MTTKTQAAKAFAEKHGSYSPTHGEYLLNAPPAERRSGDILNDGYTKQMLRDERDSALEQLSKANHRHREDLRSVMALLGVEDQYEDTVKTQDRYWGYGVSAPEQVVTEHAADKFAADLRAAQSALDGAAALKRLRKAIKNVQRD